MIEYTVAVWLAYWDADWYSTKYEPSENTMDKSGVMDRDRAKIGQTSPRFSQKKSISNRFGLTTETSPTSSSWLDCCWGWSAKSYDCRRKTRVLLRFHFETSDTALTINDISSAVTILENCSVLAQLLLSPKVCLSAHINRLQDLSAKVLAKMGIPITVEGQCGKRKTAFILFVNWKVKNSVKWLLIGEICEE